MWTYSANSSSVRATSSNCESRSGPVGGTYELSGSPVGGRSVSRANRTLSSSISARKSLNVASPLSSAVDANPPVAVVPAAAGARADWSGAPPPTTYLASVPAVDAGAVVALAAAAAAAAAPERCEKDPRPLLSVANRRASIHGTGPPIEPDGRRGVSDADLRRPGGRAGGVPGGSDSAAAPEDDGVAGAACAADGGAAVSTRTAGAAGAVAAAAAEGSAEAAGAEPSLILYKTRRSTRRRGQSLKIP
jgi:hypothetical protein